jgi:hypothetical protein
MHNPDVMESWPTSVCAIAAVLAAIAAWALVLVFGWTLWSAFAG